MATVNETESARRTGLEASSVTAILDGIGEGVTVQGPDGRLLFVNRAAADLMGFASSEAVRRTPVDDLQRRFRLWDEHGRPLPLDALPSRRAMRGEAAGPLLLRWRREGEERDRWAKVRAAPITDGEGRVSLVVSIFHDVSELRRQEESLEFQRALLEAQREASPDGILVVSPPGRILSFNRRFQEIWGLSEVELRGRSDEETLRLVQHQVEDPEQFLRRVRELYDDPSAEATDELRLKDGRVLERYSTVLRTGGAVVGRIWFFRNVTAARRAQERMRLLEVERATRAAAERDRRAAAFLADASRLLSTSLELSALLSALAAAVAAHFDAWAIIDLVQPDGRVQRFAAAPDGTTSGLVRDLEARAPRDGSVYAGRFPRDRLEVVEGLPQVFEDLVARLCWLAEGDPAQSRALIARLKPRSFIAAPIRGRTQLLGVLSLCWGEGQEDLSGEGRQLAGDLAGRIALAVENAWLYDEVRRAVVAREDFLAVASHELKTPISTIHLMVQQLPRIAQLQRLPPIPDWLLPKLKLIERQTRRLTLLIAQLLDLSRVTRASLDLRMELLDLSEVTREAVEASGEELAYAGCTVTLRAERAVRGLWDRGRVEQILSNLLSNASKYGAGKPVEVRVGSEAGLAFAEVTDHGIGIPREEQDRIFDRFERAVDGRAFSGFGLGLYISRQLAEAMGGGLLVWSEPGKGSTFRLVLPIKAEARVEHRPGAF